MSKKLITCGALAVSGFLLYRHFSEKVIVADLNGFAIVSKGGYFFARDNTTGVVSDPMNSEGMVQTWIAAQSAKSAVVSMIPGMGGDDVMLVPPPGETVTSSGQVVGGLGNDVYDASPYQYRRNAVNDLGALGFGFKSVKKAVSKVTKTVASVVTPVTKAVSSVVNSPLLQKTLNVTSTLTMIPLATRLGMSTVKIGFKAMTNPAGAFKSLVGAAKSFTVTPLMQTGMVLGIVKPPKPPQESAGGTIYQDANGNTITKEEYDALMEAAKNSTPAKVEDYKGYALWAYKKPDGSGALYLINYDPTQNACEGAYDTLAETKAAIDAVVSPVLMRENATPPTAVGPLPTTAVGPLPVSSALVETYKNNTINSVTDSSGTYYNVNGGSIHYGTIDVARAAIDATIPAPAPQSTFAATVAAAGNPQAYAASQPSSYDASNDRLGPTQEEDYGAPALPERITQVSTPSAQYAAPVPQYEAPAEPKKSGNAAVGVVVGGGLLATALMFLKR